MVVKVSNSDSRFSILVGKQPTIVPLPGPLTLPAVNPVPAIPVIKVPAPDRTPTVVDVRTGPPGPPGPQGLPGTGGSTTPYDVNIDRVSYSVAYVGKAAVGSIITDPVWQIQRVLTDVNGNITPQWAGSAAFTQVWVDRNSLTYV